jgi:outer membrane protein assembly factor BamB
MRTVTLTKVVAVSAALTLAGWLPGRVPPASGEKARPALGETMVLTRVPYPGQPAALVVDGDTVWTTTEAFMQPQVEEWPVWAYDRRTGREKVDETFTVHRPGPAVMALRGMARDAQGRLYLVDMNGRVLRTTGPTPGRHRMVEEVYATIPTHGDGTAYTPWPAGMSMPMDITFDATGNAYVPDLNFPAIWRVPPGGGEAEPWFVDPRLHGAGTLGTAAARLGPDGRDLYFSLCLSSSPHHPSQGVIYRIPVDTPTASAMTEVFRSPDSCPAGLAFGASGKLYASLFSANQIVVLSPDGTEERRFPSKQANAVQEIPYDQPTFLAFDGDGWLLVANAAAIPPQIEHSAILQAFVDDTAAPLAEPSLP